MRNGTGQINLHTRVTLHLQAFMQKQRLKIFAFIQKLVQMHSVNSDFVRAKNLEYMETLKAAIEVLTEELNPTQLNQLFKELIVSSEEHFRKNLIMDAILGGAFSP